jgi:hypothetical protein
MVERVLVSGATLLVMAKSKAGARVGVKLE